MKNSKDINLKKEYANQLLSAAYRTFSLYLSDKEQFSQYLDSIEFYANETKKYVDENHIDSFDERIIVLNAELNFYEEDFEKAKYFLEQSLDIYRSQNRKKRIEQNLFRLAECLYHLARL